MTRRERALQFGLLGAFIALFGVKVWLPMRDSEVVTISQAIPYALLFGAPQLLWTMVVAVTANARNFDRSLIALGFFIAIYALAGFFPGMKPANVGGYAHFEIPLALLAEIAISVLFLLIGRGNGKTEHRA